jgi:hypothetical protein
MLGMTKAKQGWIPSTKLEILALFVAQKPDSTPTSRFLVTMLLASSVGRLGCVKDQPA